MSQIEVEVGVYVEIGQLKTFAAVVDWPGWCRPARDEQAALCALLAYGERYARAMEEAGPVPVPSRANELRVVERLAGNRTTDFGAPGLIPEVDRQQPRESELQLWLKLLDACWTAFEGTAASAEGKELAKGPRGGGRGLQAIRDHVRDAHAGYTRQLGGSSDFKEAVWARWRGELPERGPRGGERWPPRYAIRRAAWHILDHAWDIEDRLTG